mgnify:CR=1 FL=1
MGVLKAKITTKTKDLENKIGNHGLQTRNIRDERLLVYLKQHIIHAINT